MFNSSIDKIKAAVEKREREKAERPPEDHETYIKYRHKMTILHDFLSDHEVNWTMINKKIMPAIAAEISKMNGSSYICSALGEYIIIMKTYGKLLRKKAFFMLISKLKSNPKYQCDTDLVAACCLMENVFDPIKLNLIKMEFSSHDLLPYNSKPTCDHLRIIHLVNEFYEKVFIREDYTKYDLKDNTIFETICIDIQSTTFSYLFSKKVFRYLINKLCLDDMIYEDVTTELIKLRAFCDKDENKFWKQSFCNKYYSKCLWAESIYSLWVNTNFHYMNMIKKLFVHRTSKQTVRENEVEEIDCNEILFNTNTPDEESFNPDSYIPIASKFIQFVDAYFEIMLNKCLEGQYDEENLKIYRMNSIIFNDMIQFRKESNETLLIYINNSKMNPVTQSLDNTINVKVSKALDHYVAYTRFLFFLERNDNNDYFLRKNKSLENETIRYANFNTFFDFSITIAELHLANAYIVCNAVRKLIDISYFVHYKHLVLQKFMLFLILLKKSYGVSRIFLIFFEYISNNVQESFDEEKYFWVTLFRVKFICEKEDIEITNPSDCELLISARFLKLISYSKAWYDDTNLQSMEKNLKLIIKNIKNCSKSDQFIYTNLIFDLCSIKHIFISVNNSAELKNLLMKLVSKFVHNKVYSTNCIVDKFHRITEQEFLPLLFQLINQFNLQIKEYYKIHKLNNFSSQRIFLQHLEKKLRILICKNTNTQLIHLVMYNNFELYNAIDEINKYAYLNNNLRLEDVLHENNFISCGKDNLINLKKIYLSSKKEQLTLYFIKSNEESQLGNRSRVINTKLMLALNSNIRYEDEDVRIIIDSIIQLDSSLSEDLGSYLVKENIFNFQDQKKSQIYIEDYFNHSIQSKERRENLRVVSIIRLLRNSFNYLQEDIVRSFKIEGNDINTMGNCLRNEDWSECEQNSKFYKTVKSKFQKISDDCIKSVIAFNRSYYLYKTIYKNFHRESLVENLSKLGCFKICLSTIEEFVNTSANTFGVKDIKDYDNKFMLNKYYECYSKIDENEYIMKNYVVSDDIIDKLGKSTTLSCEDGKKLTQFEDQFFTELNYTRLQNNLKYFNDPLVSLPLNMRLQYFVLIILLKTHDILCNTEICKFEKKSSDLEKDILMSIKKLYIENDKDFGQFYKNKIYYEFFLITNSMVNECRTQMKSSTMMDPGIEIESYINTRKLIRNLFTSRVLGLTTNNLLQMKIRRAYCVKFKMIDLEQNILKDIIRIYRNNEDKDNLISYLNGYSNNFEKTRQKEELYILLKSYLYLKNYSKFESVFKKNEELINQINDEDEDRLPKYKFMLLYFKNLQGSRIMLEMIESVEKYLKRGNLLTRAEYQVFGEFHEHKDSLLVSEYEKLTEIEMNEYTSICMLLIDYIMNDIFPEFKFNYPRSNGERFLSAVRLMITVSTITNKKKILFKILPRAINSLIKLETLMESDDKRLLQLVSAINTWKSDKIYFIVGQLMMIYSANQDSPMYNCALTLLTRYVNTLPHVNAYWLASFLITDHNEIESLAKAKLVDKKYLAILKDAYTKRIKFGNFILEKLESKNKQIIGSYKNFLLKLKSLHEQVITIDKNPSEKSNKKRNDNIKLNLKDINSLINNGGRFILPKLSNMSRNFNFNDDSLHYEAFQSLRVIPEHEINPLSKAKNKLVKFHSQLGHEENFEDLYITRISENIEVIASKDKPIKITLYSISSKKYFFLIKGNVCDTVKEFKSYDLISTINNIFTYEGLSTNYNVRLKQYNLVPTGTNSVMIEWLNEVETIKSKLDELYRTHGVTKGVRNYGHDDTGKIFDSWGSEGNLLYEYFINTFEDPNQWYEAKQKFITSYAAWCMVGYIIGLGDRHTQNILISNQGETCHIDFGYMLGLHRKLPIPETIDFRLTRNIRRAFGIFEEQGYFLFIAEQTLKALFIHFDSIETKLMSFITDIITNPGDSKWMADFMVKMKANKTAFDSQKPIFFVNNLCRSNSLDSRLKALFHGWAPWL